MRKTLKIRPKPIVVPETEIELKLVQDTRINPDVIHLYVKGMSFPVMQFLIRNGKLVFHRITSTESEFSSTVATETDRGRGTGKVIAEAPGDNDFHVYWPTSAEAFDEKPGARIDYEPDLVGGRPSAADLDVVAADPFYADKFVAKPRC